MENWRDIVAVSSAIHTVGLRSDGTVIAVGVNGYSHCNVDKWTNIKAVDAGGQHTVGLRDDSTVVAVGNNSHGQCNVSQWRDIVDVAVAEKTTYGLTSDGRVFSSRQKTTVRTGIISKKLMLPPIIW